MSIFIEKFCKKQQKLTNHRWSNDKRTKSGGYYLCSECTERNSIIHRRKYWLRYLAQKANTRNRPGSEKMTEEILQELWDSQKGKCFITNKPFEEKGDWAASLDRINAAKGYVRGNIVLTAWIINHIRGDMDFDKFVQLCSMVTRAVSV